MNDVFIVSADKYQNSTITYIIAVSFKNSLKASFLMLLPFHFVDQNCSI